MTAPLTESELLAQIQLACSRGDSRLLRLNAGIAWAGKIAERTARRLVLIDYHPVKLGPAGSSDLIGFKSVIVAPEMLGGRLAVFAAVEAKIGRRQPTDEQAAFLRLVSAAGGRAGIARSIEDARAILTGHRAILTGPGQP